VGGALSTIGTAAAVAGTALGAGLVLETRKSVIAFQDFEKSVSNAASVTGLAGKAFDDAKANISAVAQELGQKTSFSSSQAADALYNLASAGVDVSKITSGQLVPVLNLAAGTQNDLADTTATVTSTLSQFQLGFDGAGRVADVFAAAAGKTQANMEKLKYSMANVGTTANSLGIPLEDTTAALSTLYNAGMDGSTAGTALKGIMASLAAPTKAAATSLDMYGLKVEDVNPATHKFSDIIQTLADHGLNAAGAVDIFGREGMSAIMALTGHTGDLKTLTAELGNVAGTAQTMADQQLDTLAGSMDALSGSIENLMINVGQALAPTIRQIADSFNAMIPGIQTWVVAIVTGFTSFISQLGGSVSAVSSIGSTIIDVFRNIFSSFSGSSDIGGGLADAINGIMQRIAGIVMEAAPLIQSAIIVIIKVFSTLGDLIGGAISTVAPIVQSVFSTISVVIRDFVSNIGPTWENLKLIFDSVSRVITGAVQSMFPSFNSLSDAFTQGSNALKEFGDSFNNSSIGKKIADVLNSITTAIADFSMSVAENGLKTAIEDTFNIDLSGLESFWNSIKPTLDNVKNAISEFVNDITSTGNISYALKDVFDINLPDIDLGSIWDSLTSAFETGKKAIEGLINDLSPTWDNLKSSFDSLKTIIKEVAPDIASLFSSLAGEGAGGASSAGSVLVDIINGISGAVADLMKWLADNPKVVEFGLAIVGLAAGFITLAPAISGVIGFLGTVGGAIGSVIGFLAPLIAMIGSEGLGYTLGYLVATAFPGLAGAMSFISASVLPALSTAFGIIVNTVIPILIEGLGLLLTPMGLIAVGLAALALAWTQNWFGIRDRAYEVWEMIKTGISNLITSLTERYNTIVSQVNTLKTQIETAWTNIKTGISNKITEIKTMVSTKWDEVKTTISTKIDEIKKKVDEKWETFKKAGKDLIQKLIDGIKEKGTEIATAVKSFIEDPFGKSKSSAEANAKSTGSSVGGKAVEGINSQKGSAQSAGSGLGSSAISAISGLTSSAYSSGSSIGQSIANGLNSMRNTVASAASSLASTISSYLPHSPAKVGPLSVLPNWNAVLYDPLKESINRASTLSVDLSSTLGKLRSPLDDLRDPTASIGGGLNNVSNVTNNSDSSNITYVINFGPNNISNEMDLRKAYLQMQRWMKEDGARGGYF
jgi:TP901 family phage tail tape measure protein